MEFLSEIQTVEFLNITKKREIGNENRIFFVILCP